MSIFKNRGAANENVEGRANRISAFARFKGAIKDEFSHPFYKWLGSRETRSDFLGPALNGFIGTSMIILSVALLSVPLTQNEMNQRAEMFSNAPPELLSHWTREHSGLAFGNTITLREERNYYQVTGSLEHGDSTLNTFNGPVAHLVLGAGGVPYLASFIFTLRRRRDEQEPAQAAHAKA